MDEIFKNLDNCVDQFMEDIDTLREQLRNSYDVKREGAKYSMMIENMDYIKREYIPKEEIRKKIKKCNEIEEALAEINNDSVYRKTNQLLMGYLKQLIGE